LLGVDFEDTLESPACIDNVDPVIDVLVPTTTETLPAEPCPDTSPLPSVNEPLDMLDDDPLSTSTAPLAPDKPAEVVTDTRDMPTRDNKPPAELFVAEPDEAVTETDPPTDPAPADTDTDPPTDPSFVPDPAFNVTSPADPP